MQLQLLVGCWLTWTIAAHPLCLNFKSPYAPKSQSLSFCSQINDNVDGSCCDNGADSEVEKRYLDSVNATPANLLSEQCRDLHKQVVCAQCHPWAVHLFYEQPENSSSDPVLRMTEAFCADYTAACGAGLRLPSDFCAKHTDGDAYYAYPFTPKQYDVKTGAGTVQLSFPKLAPLSLTVDMRLRPDQDSWWIVQQNGKVWQTVDDPEASSVASILDISDRVQNAGEMGLLGLAFHPNFAVNKLFYIDYVNLSRETIISQMTFSSNPGATAESEVVLLRLPQPQENHNSGWLGFSPADDPAADWHGLYISTGDGGSANDPHGSIGNSQDLTSFLGKILRVGIPKDGASGKPYIIPPDNPWATSSGSEGNPRPEIWAFGMRNPWRCSFDKLTAELYCADVGQDRLEEVNIIIKGGNYGWRNLEADRCNTDVSNPKCSGVYETPIYSYCHEDFSLRPASGEAGIAASLCGNSPFMGQSITGGVLYRGSKWASQLGGKYIYADFETRMLGEAHNASSGKWQGSIIADAGNGIPQISVFAEHPRTGEVFMVAYPEGKIFDLFLSADAKDALTRLSAAPATDARNATSMPQRLRGGAKF